MNSADLNTAQLDATIAAFAPHCDYCSRLLGRCIELGFPPGDGILESARKSAEAMAVLVAELHRLSAAKSEPAPSPYAHLVIGTGAEVDRLKAEFAAKQRESAKSWPRHRSRRSSRD